MQEHVLIALASGGKLQKPRTAALDLDTAACLLLDVLDIGTAVANHLSTEVEPRQGLEDDGDFLFRPFALWEFGKYSQP
jgi:hypothetical protein